VLAIFKARLASREALASADEAAAALQDFHQVDARARDFTHNRQLAQASDVIFGDGFDVTQKLTGAIARALTAEQVARDATVGQIRRRQAAALAGGGGAVAILLLLLIPGGRRNASEPAVSLSSDAAPMPVSRVTLDDLNDFGVVSWPSAASAKAAGPAVRRSQRLSRPSAAIKRACQATRAPSHPCSTRHALLDAAGASVADRGSTAAS
jgi:hypothetical protein